MPLYAKALAAGPLPPGGYFLRWAAPLLSAWLALAGQAQAVSVPTTTTLVVSPSTSVLAGTILTLRARVVSNAGNANFGTVTFYDGAKQLGAAELVGSGVAYPHGTATLKLALGPGTHAISAQYGGTHNYGKSAVGAVNVAVTLPAPSATNTVINSAGSPGAYTLSGTVTAASAIAPTGTVSFLDQTNSNFLLGSALLTAASRGNRWGSFTAQTTAASTYGVIAADLNGDGIPDLITTNYGGTSISVLLGNGDGTFQPHVDYAVGTLSFGLAVGDLNADGIPDIVVGSGSSTLVSVLLGNADGTLQTAQTYDTGGVSEYVVIADFDGDGILDLATCAGGLGAVSVLLGNGDGTFGARQTFGSSVFPDGLVAGDFDHDGNLDLAVSNNPANAVSIFLGKGDGTFQVPVDYPVGMAPTNLVAVDLDGDGNPDLVVCDSVGTNVSVLLGNGDGTFRPKVDYAGFNSPWAVAAADVNGDGVPDIVVSSPGSQAVEVFLGKGDGTLLPPVSTATGSQNYLLAVGDWNGDGVTDLAVPNISVSRVSVALGSISATATLAGVSVPGGGVHSVAASYGGDVNSNPSISPPISLTGTPFPTNTALSVSPASGPVGQTFALTADISPFSSSGYVAGGSITFYDGGVAIGAPVAVAGGRATTSTNTFGSGTHSITASYSGDLNFTASTTAVVTVVTVALPQSITFPAVMPVTYGVAAFPLSATSSSGLPVSFSVLSGPATVAGASLSITGAGNAVVQADQAGNSNFAPAPPVQRTFIVNRASTTTAIAASPAQVKVNASVTLTAAVTSAGLPSPTGTLSFFDGAAQLAPVPVNASGIAAYSTSALTPGVHSITAVYSGDRNFAASTSFTTTVAVDASQTIALAPLNAVDYGTPPVLLNARASSGLPVTFSLVSGPATLTGSTLSIDAAGVVVIQADQAGDATFLPALPVRRAMAVNRAASNVALASSSPSIVLGESVTLTAIVPALGPRTPTGTINFIDGSVHLGVINLDGAGQATVTAVLTPGPHQVEAVYSGDANFQLSAALVPVKVVVPGYSIVPNPAALTLKLGEMATSAITLTPVGRFRGQLRLSCGATPQIATCSVSPATVDLPGDNLPHTVQFTLKTSQVVSSASLGGSLVFLVLPIIGWIAIVSPWARRRTMFWRVRTRQMWAVVLTVLVTIVLATGFLFVALGLTGCGGRPTRQFGQWIVVTTATGAGAPQNANITLTIVP